MQKESLWFRAICWKVIFIFIFITLLSDLCRAETVRYDLPLPNAILSESPRVSYPLFKGLKINPDDPLKLEFLIDTADRKEVSKEEAERLVRYFMAAVTVPQEDLWVNLSPYETDRVMTQELSGTELGETLISQDYVLKQFSSSLTSPDAQLGREFWAVAQGESFNKIWIVPEISEVHEEGNSVYITKALLDVKTESDYLAGQKNNIQTAEDTAYSLLLAKIKDEVNNGESFARIRQIHSALILGLWFKARLKETFYTSYIDSRKVNGIDLADKEYKEAVFNAYLKSFNDGVYNKTQKIKDLGQLVKKTYFSGGFSAASAVVTIKKDSVFTVSAVGALAAECFVRISGFVEPTKNIILSENFLPDFIPEFMILGVLAGFAGLFLYWVLFPVLWYRTDVLSVFSTRKKVDRGFRELEKKGSRSFETLSSILTTHHDSNYRKRALDILIRMKRDDLLQKEFGPDFKEVMQAYLYTSGSFLTLENKRHLRALGKNSIRALLDKFRSERRSSKYILDFISSLGEDASDAMHPLMNELDKCDDPQISEELFNTIVATAFTYGSDYYNRILSSIASGHNEAAALKAFYKIEEMDPDEYKYTLVLERIIEASTGELRLKAIDLLRRYYKYEKVFIHRMAISFMQIDDVYVRMHTAPLLLDMEINNDHAKFGPSSSVYPNPDDQRGYVQALENTFGPDYRSYLLAYEFFLEENYDALIGLSAGADQALNEIFAFKVDRNSCLNAAIAIVRRGTLNHDVLDVIFKESYMDGVEKVLPYLKKIFKEGGYVPNEFYKILLEGYRYGDYEQRLMSAEILSMYESTEYADIVGEDCSKNKLASYMLVENRQWDRLIEIGPDAVPALLGVFGKDERTDANVIRCLNEIGIYNEDMKNMFLSKLSENDLDASYAAMILRCMSQLDCDLAGMYGDIQRIADTKDLVRMGSDIMGSIIEYLRDGMGFSIVSDKTGYMPGYSIVIARLDELGSDALIRFSETLQQYAAANKSSSAVGGVDLKDTVVLSDVNSSCIKFNNINIPDNIFAEGASVEILSLRQIPVE